MNEKQKKDQEQLKVNIQKVLTDFDRYSEKEDRDNYLMGVTISCKPGSYEFHYGLDPLDSPMDIHIKHQQKLKELKLEDERKKKELWLKQEQRSRRQM